MKPEFRTALIKLGLAVLVGLVFGVVVSEVSFYLQGGRYGHQPGPVEMVIPAGTAQLIANGAEVPSIPDDLELVQGDSLVVINQDDEAHELGPLWIPAGATASLALDQAQYYQMSCSFQTSSYMGLDVKPRPNWNTRLQGMLSIGLPTGIMLWLYWLVIRKED